MPSKATIAMVILALFSSPVLAAGSIESQLKSGDALGSFVVTKLAGGEDDNIEPGERLCYRCRYGTSPMVVVFARETDETVQSLASKINHLIEIHEESRLKGLLALLGSDKMQVKGPAVEIAKSLKRANIPVVFANEEDGENGLDNYFLHSDAAMTVVLANDSRIVSVHAFRSTEEVQVSSLVSEINQLVELGQE